MDATHKICRFLAAAVLACGCAGRQTAELARFEPGLSVEPERSRFSVAALATPMRTADPVNRFVPINGPGGPGCTKPSEEIMRLYDRYDAVHYCFSYALRIDGSWHDAVTSIVWDAINVAIPIAGLVELHQPHREVLRFQAPNASTHRLYAFWQRNVSNVPPPGRYTGHTFINIMDRSIDYHFYIRNRGRGRNSRIAGVAEVIFVPDGVCAKAREEGFLTTVGTQRPCPR